MGIRFNADEIFEIAEQIERNGARFYRMGAEGIGDAENRKLLLDLAAMEDDHERTFASMRTELTKAEKKPTVFDPEGQAPAYLRDLADGHVFDIRRDPSETLTGKETMEDILRKAIDVEKDSVIFYLGMKEMVPARLGGARVDTIIHEEMEHIATLKGKLASLITRSVK